ncbi:MAG: PilN domain-containing protein [Deltaproteobacteria bacterium]|nr:PilN domain-containing protein [Deltaproteobacteria bacterium]
MIRINLLPVRAAKKKESIRFQLTVAGLITLSVAAISIALYFKLTSDMTLLNQDISTAENELQELKKQVGELSKLKEDKRVVQGKLDVVRKLESARTGPVELFTKVGFAVPPRAWLKSLADNGKVIALNGYAASDEAVADFMRGLQAYEGFAKVELVVAQRGKREASGRDMVEFTLQIERK